MPEALQSHACGRRRARPRTRSRKLCFPSSPARPRACALVHAAATLREGTSRTLGRDLVRPQLAYKSTSNLVNFPRPKAAAVH